MAENKNKVQAGRLLHEENNVQVYNLSTEVDYWNGTGSFDQVTVAISQTGVAVRVSRGVDYMGGPLQMASQVVLTRDVFLTLVASYRAFERSEKKRLAGTSVPVADDFDPFLDSDDMP